MERHETFHDPALSEPVLSGPAEAGSTEGGSTNAGFDHPEATDTKSTGKGTTFADPREHGPFVRRLARSILRDDHEADDIEQEVWLAAAGHRGRAPMSPRSWLARVTRNLAARHVRTNVRRRDREALVDPSEREVEPIGIEAQQQEARQALLVALDALDPRYAEVLRLRYLEGLGQREVAERLGIPLETVRTRQRRGLAQMRASLEPWHLSVGLPLLLLGTAPAGSAALRSGASAWAAALVVAVPLVSWWVWGGASPRPAAPLANDQSARTALAPEGVGLGSRGARDSEGRRAAGGESAAATLGSVDPLASGELAAAESTSLAEAWQVDVQVRSHRGDPAGFANVILRDPRTRAERRVQVDASGRLALSGLQPGTVARAEHADGRRGPEVVLDPFYGPTAELRLGPAPTLVGRILGPDGPVEDGWVEVVPTGLVPGGTAQVARPTLERVHRLTVEDGRFRVAHTYGRDSALRIGAPGCAPVFVRLFGMRGWQRGGERTFVLEPESWIEGEVRDDGGRLVADAYVRVTPVGPFAGRTGRTDAQGVFRVGGLAPGRYRVSALHGERGSSGALRRVELGPRRGATCSLRLDGGQRIEGLLTLGGSPVKGGYDVSAHPVASLPLTPLASVMQHRRLGRRVPVAADGRYVIGGLRDEPHVLLVHPAGEVRPLAGRPVAARSDGPWGIDPVPEVRARVGAGHRLSLWYPDLGLRFDGSPAADGSVVWRDVPAGRVEWFVQAGPLGHATGHGAVPQTSEPRWDVDALPLPTEDGHGPRTGSDSPVAGPWIRLGAATLLAGEPLDLGAQGSPLPAELVLEVHPTEGGVLPDSVVVVTAGGGRGTSKARLPLTVEEGIGRATLSGLAPGPFSFQLRVHPEAITAAALDLVPGVQTYEVRPRPGRKVFLDFRGLPAFGDVRVRVRIEGEDGFDLTQALWLRSENGLADMRPKLVPGRYRVTAFFDGEEREADLVVPATGPVEAAVFDLSPAPSRAATPAPGMPRSSTAEAKAAGSGR